MEKSNNFLLESICDKKTGFRGVPYRNIKKKKINKYSPTLFPARRICHASNNPGRNKGTCGDRCARIAPCINDSLIHDNGILNPVISMYPLFQNHIDIDTAPNVTGYIRKLLGALSAGAGSADIPLTRYGRMMLVSCSVTHALHDDGIMRMIIIIRKNRPGCDAPPECPACRPRAFAPSTQVDAYVATRFYNNKFFEIM